MKRCNFFLTNQGGVPISPGSGAPALLDSIFSPFFSLKKMTKYDTAWPMIPLVYVFHRNSVYTRELQTTKIIYIRNVYPFYQGNDTLPLFLVDITHRCSWHLTYCLHEGKCSLRRTLVYILFSDLQIYITLKCRLSFLTKKLAYS